MRLAFLGTRGVPARYSGFETAVEQVGRRLVDRGHEVTVYCRYPNQTISSYEGMRTVNLPALRLKVAETFSHTALSMLHLQRRPPDAAIVFNAANAPLLPMLRVRRVPIAIHVDGLEWRRAKWGPAGRRYYLACEHRAVRWADALIADARAMQSYYRERYGADSVYLTYGAPVLEHVGAHRLAEVALEPRSYHLVVARLEPENNVELMVRGYGASRAEFPLAVVGSAPYAAAHIHEVERLADGDGRVRMMGSVWDQELLDQLYAHAATYLHGHSVGGTNPSLLRAMGAAAPVVAFDTEFNREVLGDTGRFFSEAADIARLVEESEASQPSEQDRGMRGQARARVAYDWDDVALGYEELAIRLVETARGRSRSG